MNKKLLRKKLALMLANLKKKRKYYCEVEYIQSTGTQYIDTGYIPTNNTSFELSGIDMDYTAGTTRFGSRVSSTSENYCFTAIVQNSFRFTYGSGIATGTEYIYNTKKLAKRVSYNSSTKICTVTFNDDTIEQSTTFAGITPLTSGAKSLYLFGFNNNDSVTFGKSKQNGLKLYENGTLVRDFIPVLDWDMKPCMYDKVSGELFYNQGTGDFLYGREIHPVEYLESNGTQYIVSNLRLNGDGYSIKAKFDNTDTPDGTTAFGYQLNSNNSAFQIMVIGNVSTSSTGSIFWNGTQTASPNRNMPNVMQKGLNEISITADNGTLTYTLNGASPVSYQTYTSFSPEADSNVWLFGSSRIYSHQLSTVKFYYFKVEQNGNKICDYIPAIDENDTFFMFDKITHTAYNNAGSGSFIGPTVQKDGNGKIIENEYE